MNQFKELTPFEMFCFLVAISVLVLTIYVVPKKDAHGFEVVRRDPQYVCKEILQDAIDQDLAICASAQECNVICETKASDSENNKESSK